MERLHTDRLNRHMEPLLSLAKLILGNRSPDLGGETGGTHRTYALVWDMNVLFEEYVGRITRECLADRSLRVDLQGGASAYLAVEANVQQNAFLLRPDVLVRRGRTALVVADTKWKRLDSKAANLGVSSADIYQMLAYARRYRVQDAVLIYPHHPALGPPGVAREFVTREASDHRVRVRVLTLDLAALASVPRQLRLGLTSVLGEEAA